MSIKTVGIVCHPCHAAWNLSTAEYGRRVTGEGPTYMDRIKGQVACGECGEMLVAGYLSSHMMTQHRRAAEIGPQTYRMTFPEKGGPRKFPVVGCPGRVATRTAMRVHFVHRNIFDTVVIL